MLSVHFFKNVPRLKVMPLRSLSHWGWSPSDVMILNSLTPCHSMSWYGSTQGCCHEFLAGLAGEGGVVDLVPKTMVKTWIENYYASTLQKLWASLFIKIACHKCHIKETSADHHEQCMGNHDIVWELLRFLTLNFLKGKWCLFHMLKRLLHLMISTIIVF